MKIEKLTFQVRPSGFSQEFESADRQVWDPWLKRQKGYLGKSFQVAERVSQTEVSVIILWRTENDLKIAGSKKDEISNLDRRLKSAFSGTFQLVNSKII